MKYKFIIIMAAILLMAGCSSNPTPATVEVTTSPTETPTPTSTPTPTLTATPTLSPVASTSPYDDLEDRLALLQKDVNYAFFIDEENYYRDDGLFTEADMELLYRCVTAENGGGCNLCIKRTVWVILNRTKVKWAGYDIPSVIYNPRQFAVVTHGSIYNVLPTQTLCEKVEKACAEWRAGSADYTLLYFCDGDLHSHFVKRQYYCEKCDNSWY